MSGKKQINYENINLFDTHIGLIGVLISLRTAEPVETTSYGETCMTWGMVYSWKKLNFYWKKRQHYDFWKSPIWTEKNKRARSVREAKMTYFVILYYYSWCVGLINNTAVFLNNHTIRGKNAI